MVSRERIRAHSKEQYQLLLDRLIALQPVRKHQKHKKDADGFRAAYVLEQTWYVPTLRSDRRRCSDHASGASARGSRQVRVPCRVAPEVVALSMRPAPLTTRLKHDEQTLAD